jgi:hypothetical protein
MTISFTSNGSVNISDGTENDSVVYVSSVQLNGDETRSVTYSLRSPSDSALTIDVSTGEVTLLESPDIDVKSIYSFTVVAADDEGNSAEIAVTLAVVADITLVNGTSVDDYFIPTSAPELFDGEDGNDSVVYNGPFSQYSVARNSDGSITVRDLSENGLADELINVESVVFTDQTLSLAEVFFRGPEVEISSSNGELPQISGLAGGGYVVVWDNSNENEISGQLFDSSGNEIGSRFAVNNSDSGSMARYASVSSLSDGGFVAAWQSFNGNNWEIYLRRYDQDGVAS